MTFISIFSFEGLPIHQLFHHHPLTLLQSDVNPTPIGCSRCTIKKRNAPNFEAYKSLYLPGSPEETNLELLAGRKMGLQVPEWLLPKADPGNHTDEEIADGFTLISSNLFCSRRPSSGFKFYVRGYFLDSLLSAKNCPQCRFGSVMLICNCAHLLSSVE